MRVLFSLPSVASLAASFSDSDCFLVITVFVVVVVCLFDFCKWVLVVFLDKYFHPL